jgi:hypothetical protein
VSDGDAAGGRPGRRGGAASRSEPVARPPAATWRDLLGDARVLVSGFGRWGGGLYDIASGTPEGLDDLPTSGLCVGGGRLWRVLRAAGEQTSTCELLSYDARGLRSYRRVDVIRDPHDVCWFDGALHVSSSWDDAVWRVDPADGAVTSFWRAGAPVPDCWHVNSLVVVDGRPHVCAFGRFARHKQWKAGGAGFVHDLTTGRDVLTELAHPHTPRWRNGRWYVCESAKGALTELAADGRVLRRAAVRRFTRGLAFAGPFALVGGNAHRQEEGDRAEIVVVDLRSWAVVERIPMPCLEVYDIVVVGPGVRRAVATGFGANAARAVEQHRSASRPGDRRPTAADVALRLVPPRTAAGLAAMGEQIDRDEARRCGVRGTVPAAMGAGEVTTWPFEVTNHGTSPLGSVPPRLVRIGVRWFRLDDGGERAATGGPLTPLPRVVPPGARTEADVLVEAPAEPGRYEVRVALRQPGAGWFGARVQAEVEVKPSCDPAD